MVKDQNLSGNLSKISGPCGRLLCCLNYEEDFYIENSKGFPEIGDEVSYKGNKFFVYKNDYYNKKIHISGPDQIIEIITLDEFLATKRAEPCQRNNKCPNNRRR